MTGLNTAIDNQSIGLYYARIHESGGGYGASQTNQLIHNLKKPPDAPEAQLYYKRLAINQFAQEVVNFLSFAQGVSFYLVPMPPSRTKSDAKYDGRIATVARKVSEKLDSVSYGELLYLTDNTRTYHQSRGRRDVESITRVMRVDRELLPEAVATKNILVLDDVITSGAHFEAARKILREIIPEQCRVYGVFWAKSKNL